MNTNKYIQLITLWAITLMGLTSCDTEGLLNEKITGYIKLESNLVYPENQNEAYRVEFNGQGIDTTFLPRNEAKGELKIYPKNSKEAELIIPWDATEQGNLIQLIKLPGKKVQIYDKGSFITFSTVISLFNGYKAVLNGQQIINGKNYIQKDDAKGVLRFIKEGETTPVYAVDNFSVEEGKNMIVLQASDTEFVSLEGGDDENEPEPTSKSISKVRFFYAPVNELNVDSLRLEFIAFDAYTNEVVKSYKKMVVKKGQLSPYIELDANLFKEKYDLVTQFAYSIYNAETNEMLVNGMDGLNAFSITSSFSPDDFNVTHKFITYQITDQFGHPTNLVEALSTKW